MSAALVSAARPAASASCLPARLPRCEDAFFGLKMHICYEKGCWVVDSSRQGKRLGGRPRVRLPSKSFPTSIWVGNLAFLKGPNVLACFDTAENDHCKVCPLAVGKIGMKQSLTNIPVIFVLV